MLEISCMGFAMVLNSFTTGWVECAWVVHAMAHGQNTFQCLGLGHRQAVCLDSLREGLGFVDGGGGVGGVILGSLGWGFALFGV